MQVSSFLLLIYKLLQIPQRSACQIYIKMDSQWRRKSNKQRCTFSFLKTVDLYEKYELLSKQLLCVAEKPRTLENKFREKEDKEAVIAERLEGNDSKKESGDSLADQSYASLCKERIHNADQLVVPPWNNSDSVGPEVLKDVFQRFGSVKVSCKLCPTTNSDC